MTTAISEDGQATFGRFLDASWEVFRQQMLEVYTVTSAAADENILRAKVTALEMEMQNLRRSGGSKRASLEGPNSSGATSPVAESPQVNSSVAMPFHSTRPCIKNVSVHRFGLGDDVPQIDVRPEPPKSPEHPKSMVKEINNSDGTESHITSTISVKSQVDPLTGKRRTHASNASEQEQDDENGNQIARHDQQSNAVRHRLRLRLGAVTLKSRQVVSGKNLHDAIEALGLTSYSEEEVNDLVNQLADYIDLKFVSKDDEKRYERSSSGTGQGQGFFWDNKEMVHLTAGARPVWNWPKEAEMQRSASRGEISTADLPARSTANVVPLQALMDLFLARDSDLHKKIFGPSNRKQFQAMKEILLAGDTNRLVAELTFVRINDLAAPPEPINPLMYIEPFVAVLIVLNGVMIGFQTDRNFEDWEGWKYMEGTLAFFLLLESSMRLYLSGAREFSCGPDWAWNWFDLVLMLTGVTDVIVQAVGGLDSDMFASSLLRFCRLIRLVRVVKVFRLKCMKELRLMVKGLVAGLRTLTLSFALLFAVLYVISGFATMTIGRDDQMPETLQGNFANIPASMFTVFRCCCGECNSIEGAPIHAILAEQFGLPFIAGYVMAYMLVTMGIFNVILAVYVDITMRAAKETEATTSEQHARESIRIARTTRELLKKFGQAYRSFQEHDEGAPGGQVGRGTILNLEKETSYTDADIHDIAISKELFLLVIQDRSVQTLMDELDLPPDRANLFEVIDADGSGTMDVTELVQGMLKIRGDVKKSDTVATLLATKALQEMVTEMRASLALLHDQVKELTLAQEEN